MGYQPPFNQPISERNGSSFIFDIKSFLFNVDLVAFSSDFVLYLRQFATNSILCFYFVFVFIPSFVYFFLMKIRGSSKLVFGLFFFCLSKETEEGKKEGKANYI